MDRNHVLATMRAHEPELKDAGIVHLYLHGSVVRGESRSDSDVDLAAQFDRAKVKSPLTEISLQRHLAELLGAEVDLCNAAMLKDDVKGNFEREAVLVF